MSVTTLCFLCVVVIFIGDAEDLLDRLIIVIDGHREPRYVPTLRLCVL